MHTYMHRHIPTNIHTYTHIATNIHTRIPIHTLPTFVVLRVLVAFALCAPAAALVTYVLVGQDGTLISRDDPSLLGLCLLFSGGTFLYTIATHILPELTRHSSSDHRTTAALLAGIALPYFLAMEHSH